MTKPHPERRRFPRIGEAVKVHYRSSGQLGVSWHPAEVVNFSAGGLRCRVEEPLERLAGVELQIAFPGAPAAMQLRGQVIWTEMQASGVLECGVEYVDVSVQQQAQVDKLVGFLRNQV